MSDRHDLRRQTKEIQDALSRYEREQLIDILVHVFRTYVVEGAPLSTGSVGPSSGDDLSGLSFAQVIERLQLRLDLPELQLFEVQGGRVQVRLDGRLQPLEVQAPRSDGSSHLQVAVTPASPPPTAAAPPPRSPGVEVREVVIPPSSVPAQVPAHASSSRPEPRPGAVRATSAPSTARPAASGQAPAAPPVAAGAAPAPAAAPAAPAKADRPAEPTGTSPGGRFGLLEID